MPDSFAKTDRRTLRDVRIPAKQSAVICICPRVTSGSTYLESHSAICQVPRTQIFGCPLQMPNWFAQVDRRVFGADAEAGKVSWLRSGHVLSLPLALVHGCCATVCTRERMLKTSCHQLSIGQGHAVVRAGRAVRGCGLQLPIEVLSLRKTLLQVRLAFLYVVCQTLAILQEQAVLLSKGLCCF